MAETRAIPCHRLDGGRGVSYTAPNSTNGCARTALVAGELLRRSAVRLAEEGFHPEAGVLLDEEVTVWLRKSTELIGGEATKCADLGCETITAAASGRMTHRFTELP